MAKHLHLDCFSGISGDMMLGALIELGASPEEIVAQLRQLPLSKWSVEFPKRDAGHGLHGTGVEVKESPDGAHSHAHYDTIVGLIADSELPERVKQTAKSIFAPIAAAEAKVHDTSIEKVNFHEVGATDSIVDIVGVAVALDLLDVGTVSATPIPLGRGFVQCQHGRIPVPAPATLECLTEVPCYDSGLDTELVTPTGAGILAGVVTAFTRFPSMTIERVGYGAGSRRHADRPNLLRAVLGRTHQAVATSEEEVWEIEANIDDQTPEELAYALEVVRAAGAVDAWTSPIGMKKGRLGQLLACICSPGVLDDVSRAIFRETTTLGVRLSRKTRLVLARELRAVQTAYGEIQVKIGRNADGQIWNVAVEADDCEAAAKSHEVPLKRVRQQAIAAALKALELED